MAAAKPIRTANGMFFIALSGERGNRPDGDHGLPASAVPDIIHTRTEILNIGRALRVEERRISRRLDRAH